MRRREFITLFGGAVGWPVVGRAQQPPTVIGFLHQGSRELPALSNAFRKGLSQAGVAAGAVTIEDRAADGHYDRLPALAAELVNLRPAVIVANYLPAALAAKSATQTIPIVFLSGSDPIGSGLVSSINRPDGNITGIAPMFTLLGSKNLELLHELVPKATVFGALAKPSNPNAEHQVKDLQTATRALGQELVAFYADDEPQIDASFAAIDERRVDALVITADGFFFSQQDQIIGLAARHLPSEPVRHRRRADELRRERQRRVPANRHLCWKDYPGREACRSAGAAADQARIRRQSCHGQGARPGGAGDAARARRPGDRIGWPFAAVHESENGTKRQFADDLLFGRYRG